MLVSFALIVLGASAISICLTAVAVQVQAVYATSIFKVNLCAIGFFIMYIPFNFVSIYMYKHMKYHHVLLIAQGVLLVGCWLSSISYYSHTFWPILAGCLVVASANPFLLNCISKVVTVWFP